MSMEPSFAPLHVISNPLWLETVSVIANAVGSVKV